jgi:hypothetical protein
MRKRVSLDSRSDSVLGILDYVETFARVMSVHI